MIVGGLIRGFRSVTYILIFILLVFYIFAVVGVIVLRKNDPFLFGSVGMAMITMYRIATFEAWTNVVMVSFYGCNTQHMLVANWLYVGVNGSAPFAPGGLGKKNVYIDTDFGQFNDRVCWHPRKHAAFASVYFYIFALLGGFVLLSLFIGAVCNGMDEAIAEHKDRVERDRKARVTRAAGIVDPK